MVRAYVFVEVEPGDEAALVEAVEGQRYVTEAHVVAGDFDLVAEVEAPEVSELLREASNGIRGLQGVENTRTYVCLE